MWRNEGVKGQSEGAGLFSQPMDEELILGEKCFFLAHYGEKGTRDGGVRNIPSFRPPYLNSGVLLIAFTCCLFPLCLQSSQEVIFFWVLFFLQCWRICLFQTGHHSFFLSPGLIFPPRIISA